MPAAEFSLEARVLATEKYHVGREADLSPVDLALGWEPMSDNAVLDRLQISQGNRFYFYRWSDQPPIPPSEIVENSANMHMIPASDEIKRRLDKVRVGQVVARSGYLVRVQSPDGWRWNSSMSRRDSGSGACEVVWVKDIAVRQSRRFLKSMLSPKWQVTPTRHGLWSAGALWVILAATPSPDRSLQSPGPREGGAVLQSLAFITGSYR